MPTRRAPTPTPRFSQSKLWSRKSAKRASRRCWRNNEPWGTSTPVKRSEILTGIGSGRVRGLSMAWGMGGWGKMGKAGDKGKAAGEGKAPRRNRDRRKQQTTRGGRLE